MTGFMNNSSLSSVIVADIIYATSFKLFFFRMKMCGALALWDIKTVKIYGVALFFMYRRCGTKILLDKLLDVTSNKIGSSCLMKKERR